MTNLQENSVERKDIPGFEGLYYATSDGHIWAYAKTWKRGPRLLITQYKPESKLKPGVDKDGYFHVTLSKDNVHFHRRVNRIICSTFHPNPENKPITNHKDGNKQNNAAENLEWATNSENMLHAYGTGLKIPSKQKKGSAFFKSKLTDVQAAEIRNSKDGTTVMARIYGVSTTTIRSVKRGMTYKEEK